MILVALLGVIAILAALLFIYQTKPFHIALLGSLVPLILCIAFKNFEWAVTWTSLVALSSVFVMAQKRKITLFWSGFLAVYVVVVGLFTLLYVTKGMSFESVALFLESLFKSQVQNLTPEMQKVVSEYKLSSKDFFSSFFLGVTMSLTALLALSLILIKNAKNLSPQWPAMKLSEFVVSPIILWIFAISLVMRVVYSELFWSRSAEGFAIICTLLFFLQGISILGYAFELFGVNKIWRALWCFMIVLNPPMALLFALVGLSDYWVDFRARLLRHHKKIKKRRDS